MQCDGVKMSERWYLSSANWIIMVGGRIQKTPNLFMQFPGVSIARGVRTLLEGCSILAVALGV